MEHPLLNINNISDKKIEDIQQILSELYNKLSFAHSTGNRALINQLYMAIETYKHAHQKKMDEIFSKQNINAQINIQKANK